MAPQPLTRRRARGAQRGRDGLDVGDTRRRRLSIIVRNAAVGSALKCGVDALELEAERRREVLLVAEQHVDERHQRAVDLARLHLAADRPPQRVAVVEVVRHAACRACALPPSPRARPPASSRTARRRCRRCGTSATPACAAEQLAPSRRRRASAATPRCGRGPSSRRAPRGAEAALGEVEAVAHAAARRRRTASSAGTRDRRRPAASGPRPAGRPGCRRAR